MFEKIKFEKEDDKKEFDKYKSLKGVDLYLQIYNILTENNRSITYGEFSSYIRYDKSLRYKLYVYMATVEEYLRSQFLLRYDVVNQKKYEQHCFEALKQNVVERDSITNSSMLYFSFQPDFGDLLHICDEMNVCKIKSSDQKEIKKLRNETMHHALIMFGHSRTLEELNEHFLTIEKRLNAFLHIVPEEYQAGFMLDIKKLNGNNEKYLDKFYLEIKDGRICVEK